LVALLVSSWLRSVTLSESFLSPRGCRRPGARRALLSCGWVPWGPSSAHPACSPALARIKPAPGSAGTSWLVSVPASPRFDPCAGVFCPQGTHGPREGGRRHGVLGLGATGVLGWLCLVAPSQRALLSPGACSQMRRRQQGRKKEKK